MGFFTKTAGTSDRLPIAKTDRTNTTIIAEGTVCTGELGVIGKLHIDGKMEGVVRSEGFISVGTTGYVHGNIQADKIIISGKVEGNIMCNSLEIMQTGNVKGEISTGEFVIEPGGVFVGSSQRIDTVAPAALLHPDTEPYIETAVEEAARIEA